MGVRRYVNTDFWGDPWILELEPKEKLVFLYLLTNDKSNMLGAFELSLKVAEFELGIPEDELELIFQKFTNEGKIIYEDRFLVIINWVRHQSFNKNMLKNAVQTYDKLKPEQQNKIPECIKSKFESLIDNI
ncbi:hypothetical protein [Algoriphagus formosus]|uniref:DnaD domain-containing protein n=1 Tax=Algoriphagus formosus TaxID=2007308 RepID=A0A4R5VDD7_9BACT|nr:hypothetical protein [Algoriphagus aquimaris]TDK49716.1 hypothetical protein E1898_02405 [Algoriphagus aquimaris]